MRQRTASAASRSDSPNRKLQHAHRGQLGGRKPGTPVARVPAGEVLVPPQALKTVAHGAGDLLAVEVDAEVVAGEAIAPAVLVSGVTRQRSDDGDPVFAFGLLQVGRGGVAAVDQMLVGA
ncbi:hypothetical protein ACFFNX_42475 [Actinoallomurus acaciae]|uniref:Uncharacterized protein n=1 Tax=Actinoallomurus acaciae TaxID=502577 RepID=A0ABV5YW03_9ACTN